MLQCRSSAVTERAAPLQLTCLIPFLSGSDFRRSLTVGVSSFQQGDGDYDQGADPNAAGSAEEAEEEGGLSDEEISD